MAPSADLAALPWRSCPWVLERTNVRTLNPPLWCYSLAGLGKGDCDAAYIVTNEGKYHRCVWQAATSIGEEPSCKFEAVGCASASTPQTAGAELPNIRSPSKPAVTGPLRSMLRSPPPPIPSPSLVGLKKVPVLEAALSSKYHASLYPASAVADGDVRSLAATGKQVGNWVSVRVPKGTIVDTVSIHNRPDNAEYQAWLSPFEIWIGASFGDADTKTAARCGKSAIEAPTGAGPFTIDCGDLQGQFITLKQVGQARYLTLAELSVFAAGPSAGYPFADSAIRWPPPPSPPPITIAQTGAIGGIASTHIAASSPTLLVLRVPPAPSRVSADCRSITLRWSSTAPGAASHSLRYALFYAPAAAPSAERPWSTGLRETRATVTGLQPGIEYTFAVAEALANGASPELGPRSDRLVAQTLAKCEVGHAPVKCHSGSSGMEELHRLGAPQVSTLSCSALALELPPLPPDHCDEDRDQRLAIEARYGSAANAQDASDATSDGWVEIRHNVLGSTVIVGGLLASRAYEFRTHLHRPHLGDRLSESSGLAVVEEGSASPNATILSAPTVRSDRRDGTDVMVISWARGAGACRAGLPFTLQVSSVRSPVQAGEPWLAPEHQSTLSWQTLDANATIGQAVISIDSVRHACSSPLCTFRLLPVGVDGWVEPTLPSVPINVAGTGSAFRALLWLAVVTLIGTVAAILVNDERARSLPFWLEVWDSLRQTPWEDYWKKSKIALVDLASSLSANADWLWRSWLDGAWSFVPASLGSGEADDEATWRRKKFDHSQAIATADSDEDNMELDEFAPLPGAVPSKHTGEPSRLVLEAPPAIDASEPRSATIEHDEAAILGPDSDDAVEAVLSADVR